MGNVQDTSLDAILGGSAMTEANAFIQAVARPSDGCDRRPSPALVDTIARIGALDLPGIARDWPETRWDRYANDAAAFRGDTLLYTDINPGNFLIGHRTWAVDWAWPTRTAWIDPALLVLQLIAAGHTPGQAEDLTAGCPARAPQAVDAFALANQRMYQYLADWTPDAAWLNVTATAAQDWAEHRGVRR